MVHPLLRHLARGLAAAGLLAAATGVALAQGEAPPKPAPVPAPPAPATDKPTPDKPAEPARKADLEVRVFLKNGNLIAGYALEGVLLEKQVNVVGSTGRDGKVTRQESFVRAKTETEEGAGIRVWYPNNAKGYQFVLYTQVAKVEVGRALTPAEQEALFKDIRLKEAALTAAGEALRKAEVEKIAALAESRRAMAEEAIAKRKGVSVDEDRKRRADILKRFPPGEGDKAWNAERRAAIQRKLAVLGIPPSTEENEFIRVFGDWQKAVAEAKEIGLTPAAPASVPPPVAPPPGEKPAEKPGEKPAEKPAGKPAEKPSETPPAGGGTGSNTNSGDGQ